MKRIIPILAVLFFCSFAFYQKQGIDDSTRALFILDISKYVKWPDSSFVKLDNFTIGVLSKETDFYWELANAAKSRQFIQTKPIRVVYFRDIEDISPTQVIFVKDKESYPVKDIIKKITGHQTLFVTENFEFRNSMINFIAKDSKPQFEANEKFMNEEGMTVNQLFLALAIKTREEWEHLFQVTDVALQKEKDTVKIQTVVITDQKKQISEQSKEINRQKAELAKLSEAITLKQRELKVTADKLGKQEQYLNEQKKVINKQKIEVANQKGVLVKQQNMIQDQKNDIAQHEKKISEQKIVLSNQLQQIEKQQLVLYFIGILLLIAVALGYFIYRSYKIKKEANILL